MASLRFDYDRCTRDGICAQECVFGLISLDAERRPSSVEGADPPLTLSRS
jgi:ferredoxin